MEQIRSSIAGATNAMWGADAAQKSGEEPPSGVEGKGSIEEPFDKGNTTEQAAGSGIEPPSGHTGKGDLTDPFDQGNAPENTSPPKTTMSEDTSKPADSGLETPSTADQGSANPEKEPNAAEAAAIVKSKEQLEAEQKSTPTSAPETTAATSEAKSSDAEAKSSNFDPPKSEGGRELEHTGFGSIDRGISPGTRPDGSHATTSGERGENYEPGKMQKLKGKLHIGKH